MAFRTPQGYWAICSEGSGLWISSLVEDNLHKTLNPKLLIKLDVESACLVSQLSESGIYGTEDLSRCMENMSLLSSVFLFVEAFHIFSHLSTAVFLKFFYSCEGQLKIIVLTRCWHVDYRKHVTGRGTWTLSPTQIFDMSSKQDHRLSVTFGDSLMIETLWR